MSIKRAWILLVSGAVLLLAGGSLWGLSRWKSKEVTVCEIQGNSDVSPYLGEVVSFRGHVHDVLITNGINGLFLVNDECKDPDGSSNGIFIQISGDYDPYHSGDELLIKGSVVEVEGETRVQASSNQVQVVSLGNTLPLIVDLSSFIQNDPIDFSYEEWEGMIVSLDGGSLLGKLPGASYPKFMPNLVPSPGSQLICHWDDSIMLGLDTQLLIEMNLSLEEGVVLDKLVGYIRQDTTGYWIQAREIVFADEVEDGLDDVFEQSSQRPAVVMDSPALDGTITTTPAPSPTSTDHSPPTIIPSPTWYPVNILITEIMPNPVGKEPAGEWLEIYNPEPYAVPLTGIKIGDETNRSGKEGMLRFPDGYYIQKRDVLVIAHHAGAFRSRYGFLPDFEIENSMSNVPDLQPYDDWGLSGIQFSNSGDEVLLLDPWDRPVDFLVYGKGTGEGFSGPPQAPDEGNSLERYPPEEDSDRGGDWRERNSPSPGRLDRSPPTQPATVTSEVTPSPLATELPTVTSSPSITPSPVPSMTPGSTGTSLPTTLPPTPLPSGTLTPSLEASIIPSQTEVPSPTIQNTSTFEAEQTSTLEGTVAPTGSSTPGIVGTTVPPPTMDSTITISPELTFTSSPVASGTAEPTLSLTPTEEDLPELILNEIHADPDPELGDANGDGQISSDDDEFIELVVIGEEAIDLSGWQIEDSAKVRFVIPDQTILNPGCAIVIFGGGELEGEFGGSVVLKTSSLGLNNSGDAIVIRDRDGFVRIEVVYGNEGGQNQSLTIYPDLVVGGTMVLHGEITEAEGRLYSPGTRVDGTPFLCSQ